MSLPNQVVDGFSLTNRWLLYTSFMLSPAQFISGIGSNCPSNIGFLAYNWYTQLQWYKAVRGNELHALSLLPVHFNLIYVVTYLGGVTSNNIFMAMVLGMGTAGVIVLNTVSAWVSWATNQPDGFNEYQFFFFGWRTLTEGWHRFILVWQISDSIFALVSVFAAIYTAIRMVYLDEVDYSSKIIPWRGDLSSGISSYKYPDILIGSAVIMFGGWPLILWTELIVQRNHIESDTDMVAVWLFIAQAVAMIVPSCGNIWELIPFGCRRKK
ncbi:hypothetical protein J3459_011207 [Metarhizium acridum]|uniref:Uncharacterized protein n=1 Tax=Metarhizium acridum (strain CQMa 102) TaxID=655827 RepID=E9EG49_METAQ|nr:uncharacterized protein MAC_08847 [Metarhizium acridum CQMa 102]EFY85087.1 hypothetical protein MAC_08847 [Metarhizium acridum CQMa 102]KAG8415759.1 hypothetical protein J3458_009579 [Metarhizium acridum]KAG8420301.1 hypothetical protein J3459_011207 [Metarhizium acridum]